MSYDGGMKQNLHHLTEAEERLVHAIRNERVNAEIKHPLLFGLMTTFGFVSVLYGFEKFIDRIDLLADNPWVLLIIGLLILVATGTAYKKLN